MAWYSKKLNIFQKIAEFLMKNSRTFVYFHFKKLLTMQKSHSYVTLGNLYLGKQLSRQNVA